MGLSVIEMRFFELALKMGVIPSGGHILEFGESNVIPADAGTSLLSILAPHLPINRVDEAARRIAGAANSRSQYQRFFDSARSIYHAIFDPASYTVIDLEQGPRRYCLDLNGLVSLQRQFDCVINNGTSEHVFDQANVYRAIHDHTRPGGIMIHWTPCLGWVNHGLYNVQPGFFFDLAAANAYDVTFAGLASESVCVLLRSGRDVWQAIRENPVLNNSEVCAILRKNANTPFRPPLQGDYDYQSPALRLARMPRRHEPQLRPNLALHRPASQSSTSDWSWHDDPVLDAAGGNNGQITGYFGFHTASEYEPWWMVDLGLPLSVMEVVVHNRLDDEPWARRAAHLCIALSDDAQTWRTVYSRTEDTPFGGADGRPLRVELQEEAGRYIRIFLPEKGILHLDEIEVY